MKNKVKLIVLIVLALMLIVQELTFEKQIVSWWFRLGPFGFFLAIYFIFLYFKKSFATVFNFLLCSVLSFTILNLLNFYRPISQTSTSIVIIPINDYHYKIRDGAHTIARVNFTFKNEEEIFGFYCREDEMKEVKYIGLSYYSGFISGYVVTGKKLLKEVDKEAWLTEQLEGEK